MSTFAEDSKYHIIENRKIVIYKLVK